MKTGLVYLFFVILTLLVFSSNQTQEKKTKDDLSTCQILDLNNNCTIPEINFTQNKCFLKLIYPHILNTKVFENSYVNTDNFSATTSKCNQRLVVKLLTIIQKPFRQILHYSSEKEDLSYLA